MPNDAIVGAAVAGDSAKTRAKLESLLQNIDSQTLDVAELLHKVQSQGLYQPEFNTYKEFTRSLKIKDRKAEYLPKIVKVMGDVGIPRTQYGKVAIGRLREITSLVGYGAHAFPTVSATWKNPVTGAETPVKDFIVDFVQKNEEIEFEDLQQHVRTLKGYVGKDDVDWLNVPFHRTVMEATIRPALDKVKAVIGSVGKDEDGISKDATDSQALESALASILVDPTFGVEKEPEGE